MSRESLIESAAREAAGILSPRVLAASRDALRSVERMNNRDPNAEAADDVAAIRRFPSLTANLDALVADAFALVAKKILDAQADGFRTTAEGEGPGLGLRVDITKEDLAALAGVPVVDGTAAEHAQRLADDLLWRIRGVVTRAATGGLPAEGVAVEMAAQAQKWADAVARMVDDAWHAGKTAARKRMAAALK